MANTLSRRYWPTPKTFWKRQSVGKTFGRFQLSKFRQAELPKLPAAGLLCLKHLVPPCAWNLARCAVLTAANGNAMAVDQLGSWLVVLRLGWCQFEAQWEYEITAKPASPRVSKSPFADLGSNAFRRCWRQLLWFSWIMLNQYCLWPLSWKPGLTGHPHITGAVLGRHSWEMQHWKAPTQKPTEDPSVSVKCQLLTFLRRLKLRNFRALPVVPEKSRNRNGYQRL